MANQLLVALHGHSDARGFRQWQSAGRYVRKGERSFTILSPVLKTREADDGQKESFLLGFKGTAARRSLGTGGPPLL